jgi:hypothetical protein
MEKVLVQNASDESQVKKAEKREAFGRERDTDDLKSVLSTVQGRRFVWKYLEKCGVYTTSFSESPHRTMFLEGQRNIGLMLMADINAADPYLYVKMMNESKEGK